MRLGLAITQGERNWEDEMMIARVIKDKPTVTDYVAYQSVTPFNTPPPWVKYTDLPRVGCITDGKFYYVTGSCDDGSGCEDAGGPYGQAELYFTRLYQGALVEHFIED